MRSSTNPHPGGLPKALACGALSPSLCAAPPGQVTRWGRLSRDFDDARHVMSSSWSMIFTSFLRPSGNSVLCL